MQAKDKNRAYPSKTICWNCANAVPSADGKRGCSWSRKFIPVEGWTVKDEDTNSNYYGNTTTYTVVDCPQFVSDIDIPSTMPNDIQDAENLIASVVRSAIVEHGGYYKNLEEAARKKDKHWAERIFCNIKDIEEWICDCCDGLITVETSNAIMKYLRSADSDGSLNEQSKNLYKKARDNIRKVILSVASDRETANLVSKLLKEAEDTMVGLSGEKEEKLCKNCKIYDGSHCVQCGFVWKGRDLLRRKNG